MSPRMAPIRTLGSEASTLLKAVRWLLTGHYVNESVALASTDTVGRQRRLDMTAMRHTFVTCELVLVFIITKPAISRNLG